MRRAIENSDYSMHIASATLMRYKSETNERFLHTKYWQRANKQSNHRALSLLYSDNESSLPACVFVSTVSPHCRFYNVIVTFLESGRTNACIGSTIGHMSLVSDMKCAFWRRCKKVPTFSASGAERI